MKNFVKVAAIAATALAASAGPSLADHKPGHAPPTGSAELSLAAERPTVRYNPTLVPPGGRVTLTGRVKQPATGQVVTLLQNPAPFADNQFDPAGRETTVDAQGNFRFDNVVVPVNTQFAAQTGSPAAVSPIALVNVRPRVSFRVSDRTPSRRERVRFSGQIWPEHDGALVEIQRRGSDGDFRTVKRTAARDALGMSFSTYRTRVRIRRTGVYRVVVTPGDDDHVTGISRKRKLRVG